MVRVIFYVFNLLLIVKHEPAANAEHLTIWLSLYEFNLGDEFFPFFAFRFNHCVFAFLFGNLFNITNGFQQDYYNI